MKRIFVGFAVLFALFFIIGCTNPMGSPVGDHDPNMPVAEDAGSDDVEDSGDTSDSPITDEPVDDEPVLNEYGWNINQSGAGAFRFVDNIDGLLWGSYYLETIDPGYDWPQPFVSPDINTPFYANGSHQFYYGFVFDEEMNREKDKVLFYLLDSDGNSVFEITYKPKPIGSGDLDGVLELKINGQLVTESLSHIKDGSGDGFLTNHYTSIGESSVIISFNNNIMSIGFSSDSYQAVDFDLSEYAAALDTEIVSYAFRHRGGINSTTKVFLPVFQW